MSKTTTNLESDVHHKLAIISTVTKRSVSEIIDNLIESNPNYKKILEVTKI